MKILLADLPSTIEQVLLNVRAGVKAARNQGLMAELPDKVDFQIEVITAYQSLVEVEATASSNEQTSTGQPTTSTTTTTRTGGGQTTASTETQSSTTGTNTNDTGDTTTTYE